MIDLYPEFLPEWTNAIISIHKEKIFGIIPIDLNGTHSTMKKAREQFGLRWSSGACCLTGEAFFHEMAPFNCGMCHDFTYDSSLVAMESIHELYKFKNDLAIHLQESHKDVWSKWESL